MSTTSVPALLRQQVDRWAATWLKAKFSRLVELRAEDPGPFNYPIEQEIDGKVALVAQSMGGVLAMRAALVTGNR